MPSLNIHRIDLTLYSPQQVYSLEGEADTWMILIICHISKETTGRGFVRINKSPG